MGPDAFNSSVREQIESTVLARACHDTPDKVGDTRSFANMEQTLTREYWGRFLLELLQNARDAWLAGNARGPDGLLRIRLTKDPVLVVCNEGRPLTPDIVLHSISKFGESSKRPGEGIGHKGIGFKAVLELTHGPRLYSRADASSSFELRVRFDPDEAQRLVLRKSPNWHDFVAKLPSSAADDGRGDRIPILRFPLWDDNLPAWLDSVAAIDGRPFNTVIGLPYDARFEGTLGVTQTDFVQRVQAAFSEVTDEVVLLLRVFGRIVIEDEITGVTTEISRTERRLETTLAGTDVHEVKVFRDGLPSSQWWLFERSLPDSEGLEGALAVGLRFREGEDGRPVPVAPREGRPDTSAADCFHLFFPTRIATHLPFLLHAYFEVDASRKGFAEDRGPENRRRLIGLRELAVDAVRYLVARRGEVDLLPLPGLFAATDGSPEDPLAREFREKLLSDLDSEPWVLTRSDAAVSSPRDLLVDEDAALSRILPIAFPAEYVVRRIARSYPRTTEPAALAFLARRSAVARGADVAGIDGPTLLALLRPGVEPIWEVRHDEGFRNVLEVLAITKRRLGIDEAIETLKSDPTAVFIPVLDGEGGRRLRAPGRDLIATEEDEEPKVAGAILARVSATRETPLAPPRSLGIDFVTDGLLDAESLAGVGARLGIRPYLTEVIIDAIARAGANVPAEEALPFAWRLLLRERGKFSVINVLRTAATFEPGRWFWSKPDGNTSDGDRDDVRRGRALAGVRLPARDGSWRPATSLAFGSDWAEWIGERRGWMGAAATARAEAYRELEDTAPAASSLVASPAQIVAWLPLSEDDIDWADSGSAPELPSEPNERHLVLVHAFLLRLGVWEIPPIQGYVNYQFPRRESLPPWSTEPAWSKMREAHARGTSAFAQYGHLQIVVAEDFAFRWPLIADTRMVRALSRGAPFYRGFRKAQLFCSRCNPGGRRHTMRYSSDGDPQLVSYLAWQLSEEAWIPTTTSGQPTIAATSRDAWLPDDRPDDQKLAQSWLRFLPLVGPEMSPELASLVGVKRIAEADVQRIGRLLDTLRDRFEAGDVDRERRAGSFASQPFIGLHWRLYEQLANRDPVAGRDVLDRVGVLSVLGRSLVYRSRTEVRHDDGTFTGFSRYFSGQVPFAVLTKEQGPIADALGIERFRVEVERVRGGAETVVTGDVRGFLHERAAEILALQVYHPLGARPLQLDSREFSSRAERLRRLEVVRVDALVLRLQVLGTNLTREIGAESGEDLYLDTSQSPPTLYMDIAGTRWEDRFRARAGSHLAALLDNVAYAATFQLLLQAETEDVEAFLEERSISAEDLSLVRSQIHAMSGVVRDGERRWWAAVLALFLCDCPNHLEGEVYRSAVLRVLREATQTSPVTDLATRLVRIGGGEASRYDASPDGALALLEAHGADLQELDRLLQNAGDRGLSLQVAAQRLGEWRRSHGREVTAVLVARGMDVATAKRVPEQWSVTREVSLSVQPRPDGYLRDVVTDLQAVRLQPDAEQLGGPDASTYLAALADMSLDRLAASWHSLFDEVERARLDRERVLAWKRVLRPVIVAARTRVGDPAHVIRTEATTVDGLLPVSADDTQQFVLRLPSVLPDNLELADLLGDRIADSGSLSDPSIGALRTDLEALLDSGHLDRVIAVLQRRSRHLVDQVRRDLGVVRERQLKPAAFVAAEPPPPRDSHASIKLVEPRPRRSHDQKVRDRLGIQGERMALAVVLDALLSEPRATRNRYINELVELLQSVAKNEIVDRLVAEARAAQVATDEDDELESLARFLHVAQESDDFGFDVLGYLVPYVGASPRPLLLEVKNAGGHRFIVSTAEWGRAEQQGSRYAFLVVIRDPKGDGAASIELIPDPSALLIRQQIRREADSWAVDYVPLHR